jgi:hypothetical protein
LSISIFANKTPNYPKGFSPKTNTGISFTENKGQKCLMDPKNTSNKKSLSSLKGLILLVPYGLDLSNFIDDLNKIKNIKGHIKNMTP